MTSIVAWVGVDSRDPASLNIASDSRISWTSSTAWDFGRKAFASRTTPDIFGFAGQVTFPTTALSRIVDALEANMIAASSSGAAEKCAAICDELAESFRAIPRGYQQDALIIYGTREGVSVDSEFRLWTISLSNEPHVVTAIPIPNRSSALRIAGSGSTSIKTWLSNWESSSQGGTSRAIFGAFCDSLASGSDPLTGGAPQLVALYRKGPAKTFGTVYRGQTWFNGVQVNVTTTEVINDIEWRNSLFERCDSRGVRLETAQCHAAPEGLGTDLRGRG